MAYARTMNERDSLYTTLKEVFHLPYMYCNQQGCNETVKLPAQYCAKHKPAKLPDSVNVEQPTDKIVVKAKKTTK